jgi:hypothetical protein
MTKSKVTPRPRVCKLRFFYSTHTRHESLRNGLEGELLARFRLPPKISRGAPRVSSNLR